MLIYSDSDEKEFPDNYKAASIFIQEIKNNHILNKTKVMDGIAKRIKLATHLIINRQEGTGAFRASVYGLGGMTEQHSDSYGFESDEDMTDDFKQNFVRIGDYIATIMMYITDVPLGGGTYFSSKNYEDVVFPQKGSALLWFNLKSSGLKDWRQGHGGCPVAGGYKFAITQWIPHYDQWRKYQCVGDEKKIIHVENIIRSSTR